MSFDDQLVAPLLLQYAAENLRERGLRKVESGDCFTLLDCYIDQALDTAAAPEYEIGGHYSYMDGWKRHGDRLQAGAAAYTRRLVRGQHDIAGPTNRMRLRLRHFGYPSTFHLQLLAEAAKSACAELGCDIDEPLPTQKLVDLPPTTPARVLLQATAAAHFQPASAATRAALAAHDLFTDPRTKQINGGKTAANKARAVVRKKLREALKSGGSVELRTRHLTLSGNSQVAACLNAGLVVWGAHPTIEMSKPEMVGALGKLAHDYAHGARRAFVRQQREHSLIRARLSPLAARLAA